MFESNLRQTFHTLHIRPSLIRLFNDLLEHIKLEENPKNLKFTRKIALFTLWVSFFGNVW